MLRNKSYSFINLFSLALGITAFAFLFLWIHNEFRYEQFHADKDRLYKVWNRYDANGKINCWDVTACVLAPTLEEEYTGVENAISYTAWGEQHLDVSCRVVVMPEAKLSEHLPYTLKELVQRW